MAAASSTGLSSGGKKRPFVERAMGLPDMTDIPPPVAPYLPNGVVRPKFKNRGAEVEKQPERAETPPSVKMTRSIYMRLHGYEQAVKSGGDSEAVSKKYEKEKLPGSLEKLKARLRSLPSPKHIMMPGSPLVPELDISAIEQSVFEPASFEDPEILANKLRCCKVSDVGTNTLVEESACDDKAHELAGSSRENPLVID
eukprot:Nk52_evm59s207 gene=Nk52_evmTU59s207